MSKPTLRYRSKNKQQVREVQQRLVWWGLLQQEDVDGIFGKQTEEAVILFQSKKGLVEDGVVGTNTWQQLLQPSGEETVEIIEQCGENGCFIEPPEHEDLTEGYKLIKYFEGCSLSVYPDPLTGAEPYTVGYGSTRTLEGQPWQMGQKISKQLAEDMLRIHVAEDFLPKLRKLPYWFEMNNNQRSSLLSFAYNLGANFYGADGFETISRNLRNKEWSSVPATLVLYRNPGTSVEKGLKKRRQAEGQLWSKQC